MLAMKFVRENPNLVVEAARKKGITLNIRELLGVDEKYRTILQEVEVERSELNSASEAIAQIKNEADKDAAIEKMQKYKNTLNIKEARLKNFERQLRELLLEVPNIPDPSVPEGGGEEDNQEVRRWGEPTEFRFPPLEHISLMRDLDLGDFERGVKVAGMRGYFLKNEGALLSLALWQFSFEHLVGKGFTPLFAPALVRGESLEGTGHFPQAREDVYQVDDDLYLAGTSEIPLMSYHKGEILQEEDLPKKYVAFSPCFRKEAGSYGKDTKGLFRLHEFFKVEQLLLVKNDHQESVKWHEEITKNSEEILQALGIPYRVVALCSRELGRAHVKTYDIESWIPSEGRYRETHSSSYYHDFQTRRLGIRYKDASGDLHFAHSLNNTVLATPRILIAVLENNQQQDGSILVPEVLRKYIGKDIIKGHRSVLS